ncbi:MAG: hypothetical protein U0793_32555 [Gemmataceae bacterium]
MLKLAEKFVPAADEVYRLQNLKSGTDPECRLFQKFAELGHYRNPGGTRQGTYCVSPSGVLLGSINSNDPKRIANLLERSLAKWGGLNREERLLGADPRDQLAAIKRPGCHYPEDGLSSTERLRPAADKGEGERTAGRPNANPRRAAFSALATRRQADRRRRCSTASPTSTYLIDNVRGQTALFEERQVKKRG